MMIKKKLRKLIALVGLGVAAKVPTLHAVEPPLLRKVHESRFHMPFPVQKGGEKIDVLVRVGKTKRAHGFYLVFVEEKNWPIEKKEDLRRLYHGWVGGDVGTVPYPIKVRLQIDAVDNRNEVHIEKVVSERSPRYGESVNEGRQTWRAQTLYLDWLPEGDYRVRLENISPAPQLDFSILFAFEIDSRKY